MIKLKKLMTESVWNRKFGEPLPTLEDTMSAHQKKTITEGTRWLVGIEEPSGKITSTYGHYDGYPEWAGKHLKKFYNNPMKAKELLKLGRAGISTIGKNPKKVSHIIIDLNRDEYDLTFGKVFKYNWKVIKKVKGVGVEQLHDMIEKYTGNLTTFRPRK